MGRFGRRTISEEQIKDMLPGYEPMPGNEGYFFDSPNGRTRVLNAMPADQVYGSENFGMLNISTALEKIVGRPDSVAVRVALDDGIREHVRLKEIDQHMVRKMSSARQKEPILMMVAEDGVHVVDGHHRLARIMRDGGDYFRSYLLRPETYLYLLVQMHQFREGEWVPLENSRSPEEVAQTILRTNDRWQGLSFIKDMRDIR